MDINSLEKHLSQPMYALLDAQQMLEEEKHTLFEDASGKGVLKIACKGTNTENERVVIKLKMDTPAQEAKVFKTCMIYQEKKLTSITFSGKLFINQLDKEVEQTIMMAESYFIQLFLGPQQASKTFESPEDTFEIEETPETVPTQEAEEALETIPAQDIDEAPEAVPTQDIEETHETTPVQEVEETPEAVPTQETQGENV
ncbi:MAG: hypothetical protein K940chlam8_01271 [Chlamydiae bacterium]|nr:hypothetical protein [Chlamydiota bacterium]